MNRAERKVDLSKLENQFILFLANYWNETGILKRNSDSESARSVMPMEKIPTQLMMHFTYC